MVEIVELSAYCDQLLGSAELTDYCPNGLQLEGERPIRRLLTGVTASQALIDAALEWGADALLVHHGWFWKGESPRLVGMKARRLRSLVRGGLSLLAYHLPLDLHPELGNNRQLARVLDVRDPRRTALGDGLVWEGRLRRPIAASELAGTIARALGRQPLHLPGRGGLLERVAWCTGAAQGFLDQAANLGVDAYISGEVSEQTTHLARELGVDYFAAGHHATERYGVQAVGAHLAERFGLEHRFADIDNPA